MMMRTVTNRCALLLPMLMCTTLMPALVGADSGHALDHASLDTDRVDRPVPLLRDEDVHEVNPNQRVYNYDFGTASSPVMEGWTQVTNKARGDIYWSGETRSLRAVAAAKRENINKINTDYVTSRSPATLNHKIANGTYRVTINMGDARRGHDQMAVRAEGNVISDKINSDRRQFVYVSKDGGSETPASFDVEVEDGELTIDFYDNGGRGKYWVATRLTIKRIK